MSPNQMYVSTALGAIRPIISLLPPVTEASSIQAGKGDVIIHAPGFEDRTMGLAKVLLPSNGASAILLDYRPFNASNRIAEVKSAFFAKGVSVSDDDILEYDRFDPHDFESRLVCRLLNVDATHAIVDISTMSKLAILLVLGACKRAGLGVTIFYSEAKSYGPSKEEFEKAKIENKIHQPSLQIFTGVYGVVRVESLSSVAMQGQPTAAIVFMSFNDSLTQVLLNTVYPGRLFLINGRPPVLSWREEATAWIHEQVRMEWPEDNPLQDKGGLLLPCRSASTLDYAESIGLLLDLYWELSATHRILLAPAGSKMQAVASFFVKAMHPDIHVEYPSPVGFAPEYSEGIGRQWSVNLSDLSLLISKLSRRERREFLEIASTDSIAEPS